MGKSSACPDLEAGSSHPVRNTTCTSGTPAAGGHLVWSPTLRPVDISDPEFVVFSLNACYDSETRNA